MTSPLVERLLTNIDESQNRESRACLAAELACYWARVGEFDRAEDLRDELRKNFGDGHSVRVSILIMCIEALLAYFRELSPQARDRMVRANLLSVAARDHKLIALTSAWMAHIDFNLNKFDSMASAVTSCLSSIAYDDGTAECRVSLVLGDAFLFTGDSAPSDAWYRRARSAAERIGDQAAIGALTYNRAALHVAAARTRRLDTEMWAPDIDLVWAEIKSAVNYQYTAQLKSLDHLLKTARVGALILRNQLDDALVLINEILNSSDISDISAQWVTLKADRALALASLGYTTEALRDIDALRHFSIEQFSPDDRMLILHSLCEAKRICGRTDCLPDLEAARRDAIMTHRKLIVDLKSFISPFNICSR